MFKKFYMFIFVFAVLSLLLISGCMLGPDYKRIPTDVDSMDSYSNTPDNWIDANDLENSMRWWESLNDPVINDLVEKALANNYDLKSAAARVLEAEALLAESHGRRLPDVQYSWDRSRSKISFISPLGGRTGFINNTYQHNMTINYMVDFFGKLKRLEKAAFADLLATEANRQALTHSIIAQVVSARVQVATQQRLLATTRANTISRTNTLRIVQRRYDSGLTSSLDVYLAKENLATSMAAEPILEQRVRLAQHSLEVLTGVIPATTELLPETLPDLPDLSPVPLGLPVSLLDRRPDLKAAEYQLEAATNRIGASIAEMFPDLTLTGVGGYQSDTFRMLFDTENQVYSFIMSVAAPIYKGGRLKAAVEAAKARTEQAAANYAGAILNAVREVEDSLVTQEKLAESEKYQRVRLLEAQRGEKLSNDRYAQGLEEILVVLDSERRRRLAEDQLIQTKAELYNARVNMFLALGGDWEIDKKTTDQDESQKSGVDNE